MAEKKVNKVILNGETLIDLSEDKVTNADVAKGAFFHLPNGERVEGTYEVETLTITEYRTYKPDANKGYNEVIVAIPTWDGATESLSAFTVTIVNHEESSGPINVSLDSFETTLGTIDKGEEANFTVPVRTVINVEPGGTDWIDPRLNRVDQDDNIETSINGGSATGDLTIWGNGKITLKIYDAGADA